MDSRNRMMTCAAPQELVEALDELATEFEVSRSTLIREAVCLFVRSHGLEVDARPHGQREEADLAEIRAELAALKAELAQVIELGAYRPTPEPLTPNEPTLDLVQAFDDVEVVGV